MLSKSLRAAYLRAAGACKSKSCARYAREIEGHTVAVCRAEYGTAPSLVADQLGHACLLLEGPPEGAVPGEFSREELFVSSPGTAGPSPANVSRNIVSQGFP